LRCWREASRLLLGLRRRLGNGLVFLGKLDRGALLLLRHKRLLLL